MRRVFFLRIIVERERAEMIAVGRRALRSSAEVALANRPSEPQ